MVAQLEQDTGGSDHSESIIAHFFFFFPFPIKYQVCDVNES